MACYTYKGKTYTKEELLAIKNQIIAENETVFNQMGSEALNDVNVLVDQLVKSGLTEEVIVENTQTLTNELDKLTKDKTQKQEIKLIPTGFVKGKKVYINSDVATVETPIHEFAHLYNAWLKENKAELYNRGLELVRAELDKKNSPIQSVIDYVKSTQPNLKGEAFEEEVLTQLTGKKGLDLLQSKKKGGIIDWIKEALAEIANMLGLSNYSVEQAMNMTLDEFAKAIAVDLLRGEKLYPKATEAENYYQRNADRLPLTLSVFERPEFLALEGKMVNPITVLNSLNQTGIKQIEKDLIKGVIEESYPGQKKISYDDLEATVRANIMPLERLFTSSYADYGMNNLGDGNYGNANTIILNAPIEHGITGHFSGAFKASGRKNIKYVPKQLNDNTWVAVEEGYETGANENNIYQFVGTAGTKEAVDKWISEYGTELTNEEQEERTFLKNKEKLTDNDKIRLIYLDNKKAEYNVNKGMFGHIRVWQDGEVFTVAELQSDYFQKYNARKELLPNPKNQFYIDLFKKQFKIDNLERLPIGFEFINNGSKVGVIFDNQSNARPINDKLYNSEKDALKSFEEDILSINSMVNFYYNIDNTSAYNNVNSVFYNSLSEDDLLKIKNEYKKELNKFKEESYSKLTPQKKQFIASQKEWEKRMVREAIKEASLSGATSLRFPTPYTLSVIEGYTSEAEGTMPYDIENARDSTYLTTGDIIYYIGSEYTVLDSDSDTITIAPTKDVLSADINQLLEEEIDYRVSETMNNDLGFETQNAFYTKEEWDDLSDKYYLFDGVDLEDIANEREDGVYEIRESKVEDIVRDAFNNEINSAEELLNDIGYDNIYTSGDSVYYTEYRISTETLGQPDTYSQTSKEDFSISDLSSDRQTVARKYEEIADILKQERGEENVEIITDENGFDWYETKLAPEEINQPVVAFQKQFEVPTEEATTIPDCV